MAIGRKWGINRILLEIGEKDGRDGLAPPPLWHNQAVWELLRARPALQRRPEEVENRRPRQLFCQSRHVQ